MTLRILLLDDHQMLVEALAARLGTEPDLVVDTRGPSGLETVVAHAVRARPDVVVLEVSPLNDERRELILALRRRLPESHVIALSADEDPRTAGDVAVLGAEGWVSKEADVGELVAMVRAAARGHGWFPPEQLGAALERLRGEARRARRRTGPLDRLTDREREILTAMVRGEAIATLARKLRLSENTVRSHVGNMYAKLGVHSRLEAIAFARSAGLPGEPAARSDLAGAGR
ncbi:response regulator transcription factor [Actinomycetospora sp. TBRC 11914]|uniref:LuxR C-terminal-related transcriptional regulator n=1 Tax=Actinomycetospora sp. TBRC 11914 TaxID=2729387 RepID=UPI00145F305D|nr:response regulator transcription factor [Actinomycetospora sp. TBRC 11914]NMO92392.1 response regulator transcription factor [Actinomycetospora sp. TBRC 11914]